MIFTPETGLVVLIKLMKKQKNQHLEFTILADTDYDPVVHYSTIDELNQKLGQALAKSLEWENKIPTGVFYKNELITPYTKRITDRIPNYLENPAAQQKISKNGKSTTDISKLLDSLLV